MQFSVAAIASAACLDQLPEHKAHRITQQYQYPRRAEGPPQLRCGSYGVSPRSRVKRAHSEHQRAPDFALLRQRNRGTIEGSLASQSHGTDMDRVDQPEGVLVSVSVADSHAYGLRPDGLPGRRRTT